MTSGSRRSASAVTDVVEVEIAGRTLKLSNLDKVLWPAASFMKRQMISYYVAVAPVLLPHLAGRPLTVKRYPEGVEGMFWFQTQCRNQPEWVRTRKVPSVATRGKVFDYCVVDDLPSLVWIANLAAIELHPLLARGQIDEPSALVFDLDPGPPADVIDCCDVALWLRSALEALRLACLVKTSGSKGLHVFVPLNSAHTYEDTKSFARRVARALVDEHPEIVVDKLDKSLRPGKVLIDASANNRIKSTVAAYSLRATSWPNASTPVSWDEVEQAAEERDARILACDAPTVLERVERLGDLFRPVLELQQTLPV